jgi:hypothetical protein
VNFTLTLTSVVWRSHTTGGLETVILKCSSGQILTALNPSPSTIPKRIHLNQPHTIKIFNTSRIAG